MSAISIVQTCVVSTTLVLTFILLLRRPGSMTAQIAEKLQSIKLDLERLDRVVREDGEMARTGADERGRLLREEVSRSLAESRSESGKAMAELRGEVATTLNKAAQDLSESSTTLSAIQKERLDDMAIKIGDMTKLLDERLETSRTSLDTKLAELRTEWGKSSIELRDAVQLALVRMGDVLKEAGKDSAEQQRLVLLGVVEKLDRLIQTNSDSLEKLRDALQKNLDTLRQENSEKLETMRQTVDEKLQGTLEKRLGESFKIVSERLEEVHKGLGEMQTLATGVGDLKRVLTNVKVRGVWAENQLSNLLAQVFSPEQYFTNHSTRPGSSERVEFAIRFPGRDPDDHEVLLPIDAKFPKEDYERLVAAAEVGDEDAVEAAIKALEIRIKGAASDICDKYICPPHTTDFALMYLPTEGLYAEVLRRPGLADFLQQEFRVAVAGPTTIHAFLNSLQMGFRTLAIQRRSSEVWEILGAVKTEFGKYGTVLDKVQKKLQEASSTVDAVAVRHRAVIRSLRTVADVPDLRAQELLSTPVLVDGAESADTQ